ncbi:MAG TPA: methyltransferase type 11, partial [Brevundimonas sp.]|nr:methyltransferase type 11 [Brevundimonas sp.]
MPLRPFLIPALCAFAGLSACGDGVRISSTRSENNDAKGVLKVVETLQCPQTMGSLTRKGSASEGGTVCTYVGPKGAEVSLHLVPLDGETPAQVLKAFEQRLSGDLPRALDALEAAADS